MEQLLRGLLGQTERDATDKPDHPDTAETVNISALALLKMLRHARSGVPLEVMGLMLGTIVDDYTIDVVDVFAMPQSGTSITVESVDPVYQTKHLEKLQRTGRHEMVVGWYHSHPGFGCWLSSTDVQTQKSFEALQPRAVAVVVDPIQSVKGKVVLEAFRSINPLSLNPKSMAPTGDSRQCTSNVGHLQKPTVTALAHGLDRRYYNLVVNFKLSANEQKMLLSLNRKTWSDAINVGSFSNCSKKNVEQIEKMIKLTEAFTKELQGEPGKTKREDEVKKYGRLNAKQRLEQTADEVMEENIVQQLKAMTGSHALH